VFVGVSSESKASEVVSLYLDLKLKKDLVARVEGANYHTM
jgi:hypothetical protein